MLRSGMNTSLIEDHLTGQEVALMSRAKSNLADICATWIELMTNEDGEAMAQRNKVLDLMRSTS
jgi:hypothetical protein